MTAENQNTNDHLVSAARAYTLNGYIKISGMFSQGEIDKITNMYDKLHDYTEKPDSESKEKRIPPTGSLLEKDSELTELIFAKDELFQALRSIAGRDVQFAGSDAVHVYNDSIGIHRDTFYKFDFPKVLIFLSDCPRNTNFTDPIEKHLGGSFMVLPGSHNINDEYSARSSRLCNWPYNSFEHYSFISPTFTLGESNTLDGQPGRQLLQCHEIRDKYHAFAKIAFKKGDIVVFSTRALHALYPLFKDQSTMKHIDIFDRYSRRKNKPLKLLGLLFIEGFSNHFEKSLAEASSEIDGNKSLIDYISTVYNLRLYNTTTDHAWDASNAINQVSGLPMGLNRHLNIIKSTQAIANIERHNLIHKIYEHSHEKVDEAAGRNKIEIDNKFLATINYHAEIINSENAKIEKNLYELSRDPAADAWNGPSKTNKKWSGFAKYLPFIENESYYLFYKRISKFLKRFKIMSTQQKG